MVSPKPSKQEIHDYYQGFAFEVDESNLKFFTTPKVKQWMASLKLGPESRMLDIGGGAGFSAAAFEHFKFGKSTYIDLDASACDFAKNKLKLSDVRNVDAAELCREERESFDFIYCRHVIEHLIDPTSLIDVALQLLKAGGTFVLQFPNGLSLEYLAYPRRLKPFAKKIKNSNNYNWFKTITIVASKQNAFAIDPVRHLWAITPKGISLYLEKSPLKLDVSCSTESISNSVYSPYYRDSKFHDRVRAWISRCTIARLRGGAHAVVKIKKPA